MESSSDTLVNADWRFFPELREFLKVPLRISNNVPN